MRAAAISAGIATLLVAGTALAAPVPPSLDTLVQSMSVNPNGLQQTVSSAARQIFGWLWGIDAVIVVGFAMAARAGVVEILVVGLKQIILGGFFGGLLLNGPGIAQWIIQQFVLTGNQASVAIAGVQGMSPTDIADAGINVAHSIFGLMMWHPFYGMLLALAGIVVLVCFALIASMIVLLIAETSILAFAGVILLGLGGSCFTRDYAIAFLRFCVAVGFKRMVLQIIVALGAGFIANMSTAINGQVEMQWNLIGWLILLPIVLATLTYTLPYRASDMINGTVTHSGFALASTAAMIGGAAFAGATAAAGGLAAGGSALKLGAAQAGGAGGGGVAARLAQAGRATGSAAKAFGQAAANDVGRRLTTGSNSSMGWRMASQMQRQLRDQQQNNGQQP